MQPTYDIKKLDKLNWKVTRTSQGKDKDGNAKIVTRDMGFYNRLDQAVGAVYELAVKDNAPNVLTLDLGKILALTQEAKEKAVSAAVAVGN